MVCCRDEGSQPWRVLKEVQVNKFFHLRLRCFRTDLKGGPNAVPVPTRDPGSALVGHAVTDNQLGVPVGWWRPGQLRYTFAVERLPRLRVLTK